MNKFSRLFLSGLNASLLLAFSYTASASVVITGTRVIYPSDAREVSVKLANKGKKPVLIQSWIDDGDVKAKPDTIHVPFVLTPPINRVEPEKGQTLRISYMGKPLPADRESIYWLNVLEIPAKNPLLKDSNLLQMAFRSRIKFFFRPVGLKGNANDAAQKIVWKKNGQQLIANNPTPYYISLTNIVINDKNTEADTIAPFSEASFTAAANPGEKIKVNYINDYGASISVDAQVN